MKRIRLTSAAFALLIVVLASCSKTDMNTMSPAEAESIIPGNYKVNMYDNGSGNTAAYENYDFEFQSNGAVVASNGVESYSGVWTITSVNHADYDKQVKIAITGNSDMDALSHDWFVEDVTDVTLYLTDEDASDIVHFIKN